MNAEDLNDFDVLTAKFAELITGDSSPEMVEKIKIWSIYNHIHKTMPALASHWNQDHPAGKAGMRALFEEIRELNRQLQAANAALKESGTTGENPSESS